MSLSSLNSATPASWTEVKNGWGLAARLKPPLFSGFPQVEVVYMEPVIHAIKP
ncbi:MAG: hypothetical protein ABIT70_15620 [Sulfuriferula sp.]